MNKTTKQNIAIMRLYGCSYANIAKVLGLNRNTVISFCHNQQLKPITNKPPHFAVCDFCGKIFAITSDHDRHFCSDDCRNNYWRRERQYQDYLERRYEKIKILHNSLDSLAEESYECIGTDNSPSREKGGT